MYNRRYEKVFLMLRQEVAGYALGKRPPWGSCVMEIKNGEGKLHLTVQGLRPLRKGCYGVYVMAGAESIFCGELHPDRKEGHGEIKWAFQPDEIGNGKKAEDLHTVILLAEDGKEGLSAPLTAYFGEKRNWRTDFLPRKQGMPEQESAVSEEIRLQAAEAALAEPPLLHSPWKEKDGKDTNGRIAEEQKQSYHGSFQGLLEKFRRELEELEETGVLSPQETERIRNISGETKAAEAKPEEAQQEQREAQQVPERPVSPKGASLFAENRELEPFAQGEAWKCLSLEELTLLSQIPLKWQREFFFLLPYRRYHHLILRETNEGIWLGLPGVYHTADEADAAAFGFREFRRVEGDWGYWMTFLEWEQEKR